MEWNIEWEAEDEILRMSHCSPFVKSSIIIITSSRSPSCTPARPINPNGSDDDAIWTTAQSYSGLWGNIANKILRKTEDGHQLNSRHTWYSHQYFRFTSPCFHCQPKILHAVSIQQSTGDVAVGTAHPFNRWSRSWVWAGVEMDAIASLCMHYCCVVFCVASVALYGRRFWCDLLRRILYYW